MTKIKICGIKNKEELDLVLKYGIDAVGFICEVPVPTPRKISLETASALIASVPLFVSSVLVIMPENADEAIRMVRAAKPTAVQIHNDVPPELLGEVREAVSTKIIKTLPVPADRDAADILIECVNEFEEVADAVLLDTAQPGKAGGTGITHNWEISAEVVKNSKLPIILAGGLNPENVKKAILTVHPYAVDTASGVETGGNKDGDKVRRFVQAAHKISYICSQT